MHRISFVSFLLFLLAACADMAAVAEGPYLHADVEGAATLTHRGGATHGSGTRSQTQRKLYIHSADGDSGLTFEFLASSQPWPRLEVGTYPLDPRHFDGGDNEGNTAIHRVGSVWYIAEVGTLTITHISADYPRLVSGHFDLTAVFWCDRAINRDACLILPDEFSADRPRVQIRGSFRAGPEPEVPRFSGGGV
jgi:hypothetical protein